MIVRYLFCCVYNSDGYYCKKLKVNWDKISYNLKVIIA